MIQPWRELCAQPEMLSTQLFRNLFQRLQVRRRVTIPKLMVGYEL